MRTANTMIERNFTIVIIGGGFSGTMLAVNLMRRDPSLSIAILDKAGRPGRGIAYATEHPSHLLNVPAAGMTALPEEPDHFLKWAQANYDTAVHAESFLPRLVYGRYIESLFEDANVLAVDRNLEWIKDEAISVTRNQNHFAVQLRGGQKLQTNVVVFATGNLPASNPRIPGLPARGQRPLLSAWSPAALDGIPPNGNILLIGSGLTAVDMVVALDAKEYEGTIRVVSRHGLMPQDHGPTQVWRQFWHSGSPRTTRGLLRLVRDEIDSASALGIGWRAVIDALRPVTQEIWMSLPYSERRRFLRHVRTYWDTHRHRVAPEINGVLKRLQAEGRLHLYAGRIANYAEQLEGITISLRQRAHDQQIHLLVDRVINCTGSESDCRRVDDSLLKSLFAEGLATPDPLCLGLNINTEGFVLDHRGVPSHSLCAIGPPTKGGLWEAVAVPELRQQAAALAKRLVERFGTASNARSKSFATAETSL
jgi:uncharacterized NAD(P)/FAD-binding protein YdhS